MKMKCRKCDNDAVGFQELQPKIVSFLIRDRPTLYEALCEEHLIEVENRAVNGRYYWLSEKQIKKIESEQEKKQYKKLKKKYEKPSG